MRFRHVFGINGCHPALCAQLVRGMLLVIVGAWRLTNVSFSQSRDDEATERLDADSIHVRRYPVVAAGRQSNRGAFSS